MSTLSLRLPDSLHEQVKALAKKDGISFNQFAASAIAEKMAAYLTEEYLNKRASAGNQAAFLAALNKVPDVAPTVEDTL
jgi:predicted transcriptional regulator